MNAENKNSMNTPKQAGEKSAKKNGLSSFLKSRKAHHGAVSVAIIAVVIAIVIVINVVCSLLVDRFPNLKFDLTSNQSFALQEDTIDYMSHLNKDVTINILKTKSEYESAGTYFIQSQNLLEKMVSNSNGKLKLEYVNITENPTFTNNYPNIDWTSSESRFIMLIESGKQYKALSISDCFDYDEQYYSLHGEYFFTGTKIEQAVVTTILNVTTDDKVLVDIIKGNQEQNYSPIKTLLENNAYDVKEISLVSADIDEDASYVMLYAPSVDLDDKAVEKITKWLNNDGKYGKSLIYLPTSDKVETPNIDALLADWGVAVDKGMVFETDGNHLVSGSTPYAFIADYTDYYKENLKNPNIPTVVSMAHSIEITDSEIAHSLLNTSENAGIRPVDAGNDWDYKDSLSEKSLSVATESVKTNTEDSSSRVLVFGSFMMFDETIMSYNSFNNSAYFMNIVNTISDKDDSGITIESKSLESKELGATDVTIKAVMLAIFVFIIPIGILITGIILWLRRRNK